MTTEKMIQNYLRGSGQSLWRMSSGDKAQAMAIVRDLLLRGKDIEVPDFETSFDCACADILGDGCEVEWVS